MQKSKLQRMSMGRWGETEGAPGVKLWRGGMRVVKQGRTTREEVRGCAGGGDPCVCDPCACGLLLQLSRALLLRWLQLGLPLQRRRRAMRARGQGQGSGRPGRAGEKCCTSLFWRSDSQSAQARCSFTRPPARRRALSRPQAARFPASHSQSREHSRPQAAHFSARLNVISFHSAPIKRRRTISRAPRRAQRLIERLPPKRDAGAKFSV
jgi:hypothetical protein